MTQVTAAIIRKDGEILICQRSESGNLPLLWEFPGGKLEDGETLEECLIRECKEELDIDIWITNLFAKTEYQYPKRRIALTFFNAEIVKGEINLHVHNAVKWVYPEELISYKFCPADVEIATFLCHHWDIYLCNLLLQFVPIKIIKCVKTELGNIKCLSKRASFFHRKYSKVNLPQF